MIIEHRGIYQDRFDAPFIGTLIAAKSCKMVCEGCFHREPPYPDIQKSDADNLLDHIQSNPFTEGIILGYFEWLDYQYDECIYLIEAARKRNLHVILYTRRTKEELLQDYPKLFTYPGLYIKCGSYDKTKLVHNYTSYGVPLASSNQYIFKV